VQQTPPARIVVRLNWYQTRAHITRYAPGESVGTTRIYPNVTPSSAARLRRVLGGQLRQSESGTWRADLVVSEPAPAAEPVICDDCGAYVVDPAYQWPSDAGPVCQDCWERLCDETWAEVVPQLAAAVAASPLRLSLRPTDPYAPRPLYTNALMTYRLGMLAGERRYRCLGSLEWYRQARRRRPGRFSRQAGPVNPLAGEAGVPDCSWCGGPVEHLGPPSNRVSALCLECLAAWIGGNASQRKGLHRDQGTGRRARYARPVGCSSPAQLLRESRLRPAALRYGQRCLFVGLGPRRRTRHFCGPVTLRYLTRRRALAARCQRRGFERIRPFLWYDRAADVVYYQSAGGLERCEHVRLGAA
jgi:hypothetical protein